MTRIHTDLSMITVSVAPSPAISGTTLGVSDANAALLPDVYPFWALVKPAGSMPTRSNGEIVKVMAGSSSGGTTTYTIVRAQGIPVTTARTIVVGDEMCEVHAAQKQIDTEIAPVSIYRQAIINGNFDIWQRGQTFTNPADAVYTTDRWIIYKSTDGAIDVLATADCPTAAESGVHSQNCLNIDVTTADATIAAGQYYGICHRIEGYNIKGFGFGQSGTRKITLSFWVKSTKTGTFCVAFGNGSFNRTYVAEYTVSSSNTWEKKIITLAVDTTGTWAYDNTIGLTVVFTIACGSTFQTTANAWGAGLYLGTSNQVNGLDSNSNFFKLSQVQLCAGEVALPFMPRSYGEELALCQRYCFAMTSADDVYTCFGPAIGVDSTHAMALIKFPVEMRAKPVGAYSGATDFNIDTSAASTAVADNRPNRYGTKIYVTVASGLTAGRIYEFDANNKTTASIIFSAEL